MPSTTTKKLIKVRFIGALAELFGELHEFVAFNIKELGSALRVCIPGFEKYVLAKDIEGVRYRVIKVRGDRTKEYYQHDVEVPFGNCDEVIISPEMEGAGGRGFFSLLTGALLIGVGMLVPGLNFLTAVGASMALSGIASMLAPSPTTPKTETEKEESYLFNGLSGQTNQDNPVPLIYGECFVPLKKLINYNVVTVEYR